MGKKEERKGQASEPSPQSWRRQPLLTGAAQTCAGCGKVLSVEVSGADLLPLLKAGEALVDAYRVYATLRSLSPDKPIWSDAFACSRIRDAEASVLRELEKLGRSGKYPEFVENCPCYTMSEEVFMAIDVIWAATCLQPLEDLIKGVDFPRAVEGYVTKIEKALTLLASAAGPSCAKTDPADREASDRASPTVYSFARQGQFWRVAFGGEPQLLKHHAGMEHIAQLLARPDPARPLSAMAFFPGQGGPTCLEHGSSPVLDAAAKLNYQRRLQDLREDEEEAKKRQDERKQLLIAQERDAIRSALEDALGLQARDRKLGPSSPAQKAADSVRKSIARARKYLEEAGQKKLAAHLKMAIRKKGETFAYCPQPPAPTWEL